MAYQAARGTIPAIRVVATMMKDESKILSCFGGAVTFEAVVMHELGHVLGPGHGADPTSVMDATLGAGTADRNLTTADLDVPESDGGGPAGLHARVPRPPQA
jgi:predicted Zn-dependent protease